MEGLKARLAQGYSRTASRYDEVAGLSYLSGIRRLLPYIQLPPYPSILDVGCGTGINLIEAARCYSPTGRLAGIDISPGMVAVATEKTRRLGLQAEIVPGDAERLPYPDASFDLLLCNSVFHWFKDRRGAMKEMARVLKPGGRLALITATAPGFGEWFILVDAVVRASLGPSHVGPLPQLPTGPEVAGLAQEAGLTLQHYQNPVSRGPVEEPEEFVQVMSVIAPHWASDLPDQVVVQLQQRLAQVMRTIWPMGFPFTWSAVECIGQKV